MKLAKKTKRLLAYVGILGGCAILALTFFSISQYEKAKYQAANNTKQMLTNRLNKVKDVDSEALTNPDSAYYPVATWYNEALDYFVKETEKNSHAYVGTAIPAYTFSMGCLVAFGLILKHAEKAKEKEDEEAVLGQGGGK